MFLAYFQTDFLTFFEQYRSVRSVFFNGAKAFQVYKRYVLPSLGEQHSMMEYIALPSTSPANARMRFDEKLVHWKKVKVLVETV